MTVKSVKTRDPRGGAAPHTGGGENTPFLEGRGLVLILLSLLFTAILWIFPDQEIPPLRRWAQVLSSEAVILFMWMFFIAARWPSADTLFRGLEKAYRYHRFLGPLTAVLLTAHWLLIFLAEPVSAGGGLSPGQIIGFTALGLLLVLTGGALAERKIDYQRWKNLHGLLIIPYGIGLVHLFLAADAPPVSLRMVWLAAAGLTGFVSAFYALVLYEQTRFRPYRISRISMITPKVLELTVHPRDGGISWEPGQFAFLRLNNRQFFPSHPFSICGTEGDGSLQFAVKALGDHTDRLPDGVFENDTVWVEGPHGRFLFSRASRNQVWIAGGVGITPFRSFYSSEAFTDYRVTLFYTYHGEEGAPFLYELLSLEKEENFLVILHDSSLSGRFTPHQIHGLFPEGEKADLFLSGPPGMVRTVRRYLKEVPGRTDRIYREIFQLR